MQYMSTNVLTKLQHFSILYACPAVIFYNVTIANLSLYLYLSVSIFSCFRTVLEKMSLLVKDLKNTK